LKIAIIVRNYHKSGGISGCAAELAGYFALNHNEVHIFAASWKDADDAPIIFHKVPAISFKFLKDRGMNALNNIFEMASFAVFSRFAVKPKNFDIVHSHGSYMGRFDIFTAHSCHAESLAVSIKARSGIWGKLKKTVLNPLHLILLCIEKYSVKHANRIITVSRRVKGDIIKHYNIPENRIDVVINGVDIERFNPRNNAVSREAVRKRLNLKPEDKVIIFPAHEFERKGLYQLIQALNLVHFKDLFVVAAGEDDPAPFARFAKKYGLENNIIFTGKVTDMEKYYSASDLLVFPTYYEPFGLVILEAMASGLPVITSALAGAAELISDKTNGVIIKNCADYRSIAGAIRLVINDGKTAGPLGENARKSAEQYSWSAIAEKTFSLYEDVMLEKAYESDFGHCISACMKSGLKRNISKEYTLSARGLPVIDPICIMQTEQIAGRPQVK